MSAPVTGGTVDRLGREVATVARQAGLVVDGSPKGSDQPGLKGGTGFDGPVRASCLEIRDPATRDWLFAVAMRETSFNVRVGIARHGETIVDSWPHDDGGHVDGRCFSFQHGDEGREGRFLQALAREVDRHRAASPEAVERIRAALEQAVPDVGPGIVSAMAAALAVGCDDARVDEIVRRLSHVPGAEAAPAPGA